MTLATRCSACGTVFRVVQDQLRVSEGWVRCGRCNQVFNAAEHLVDLARVVQAPPPAPPPAEPELPPGLVQSDGAVSAAADIPAEFDATPEVEPQVEPLAEQTAPLMAPAMTSISAPVSVQVQLPAAAPIDPDALRIGAVEHDATDLAAVPAAVPGGSESDFASTAPSFVQAAERAARWQRPALRRGLAAAALLLIVALALQVAVEYRDVVAARWTATRPLLELLCRWSRCRIEAPRWIEALAVDASGLVRVEGTNTYRLSIVLHNRSAMAIALPSIDLLLTDVQGKVIARRAFLAAELGSSVTTVAPAAELPLQATLSIAERAVAGYTIEIFYP